MKVMVSGASGLIGRLAVKKLAAQHEVFALARREPPSDLPDGVEWIRQDLTERLDQRGLPAQVDGVVHLAQSARYQEFPDGAEDIFAVNVHGTARLLEYARRAGAQRFVLTSTGGNYVPGPEPVDEGTPLATPGFYFRSKRMAELLVEGYGELMGGAILRLFFVYGPGQPENMLVSRLAGRVLTGEEIAVEGDPGMRMNPIFVDDAAAAIAAALELPEQAVVNVAGEEVVTLTELVKRIAAALGREAMLRHTDAQPDDLVADTTRMNRLLGVSAQTNLDDGLRLLARSLVVGADLQRPGAR
jgi:UDP-glucose 4-epimerase